MAQATSDSERKYHTDQSRARTSEAYSVFFDVNYSRSRNEIPPTWRTLKPTDGYRKCEVVIVCVCVMQRTQVHVFTVGLCERLLSTPVAGPVQHHSAYHVG